MIDTDLNYPSDDFEALLLLAVSERVQIVACSAVAGNTWMEEVCCNLRAALSIAGLGWVPIGKGGGNANDSYRFDWANRQKSKGLVPFIGAYQKARHHRCSAADLRWLATLTPFVEVLSDAILTAEGEIELLCIGPLTNLAAALDAIPALEQRLGRVVVMGGHFDGQSLRSRSDFNFWFDPGAASKVFASSLPVTVIPLDVCRTARCDTDFPAALNRSSGRLSGVFHEDVLGMLIQHGVDMPFYDQLAAAVFEDDSLITSWDQGKVTVQGFESDQPGLSTFSKSSSGMVKLVRSVDVDAAKAWMVRSVEAMDTVPVQTGAHWDARIL